VSPWLTAIRNPQSAVGFIALFGVAVLNGVVMIAAINRLREDGRAVEDAVREWPILGCGRR